MNHTSLPHRKLIAYQLAVELVSLVARISIDDSVCREHARKSARSAALNIAEAAGRRSDADKSRIFAIARGEAVECIAAIEIAAALGACSASNAEQVVQLGGRVSAILSRLIR